MKPMPIRVKAGIIAIVLWGLSLAGLVKGFSPLYEGAFVRSAVVMTLLWLAWPELVRLPRWLFIVIPIVLIIAAFQPRILFVMIPLLLLYGFLIPKPKKGLVRKGEGKSLKKKRP